MDSVSANRPELHAVLFRCILHDFEIESLGIHRNWHGRTSFPTASWGAHPAGPSWIWRPFYKSISQPPIGENRTITFSRGSRAYANLLRIPDRVADLGGALSVKGKLKLMCRAVRLKPTQDKS